MQPGMQSHFLPVDQKFPQAIQRLQKGSRTLSLYYIH